MARAQTSAQRQQEANSAATTGFGGDRRGPMTSAQADAFLTGSDAPPGVGGRLRRVLVADAQRLAEYIRSRDTLLAYHALVEAETRADGDLTGTLALRLRDQTDGDLSAQAARVLGKLGGRTAVAALLRAQGDSRAVVRTAVRASIAILKPEIQAEQARRNAVITEQSGANRAAYLAKQRKTRAENASLTRVRRYLSASSGGYSLPASLNKATARRVFLEALRSDPSATIRARAAHGLGLLRDVADVPELVIALRDKSAFVRLGAAWSLANIGSVQAIVPLRQMAREDAPDAGDLQSRNVQARAAADEAILLIRRGRFPQVDWTSWPRIR